MIKGPEEIHALACPFCGTYPGQNVKESFMVQDAEMFSMHCGECGAGWPPIRRDKFAEMSWEDVQNHFNKRSLPKPPSDEDEEVHVIESEYIGRDDNGKMMYRVWYGEYPLIEASLEPFWDAACQLARLELSGVIHHKRKFQEPVIGFGRIPSIEDVEGRP